MKQKKATRVFVSKEASDAYYRYLTVGATNGEIIAQYHTRKRAEASPEFVNNITVCIVTRKQFQKKRRKEARNDTQ